MILKRSALISLNFPRLMNLVFILVFLGLAIRYIAVLIIAVRLIVISLNNLTTYGSLKMLIVLV